MTFGNQPMAMNMSFGREYSERYDWLLTQFKDWSFTFVSSYLYYEDYDKNDETFEADAGRYLALIRMVTRRREQKTMEIA